MATLEVTRSIDARALMTPVPLMQLIGAIHECRVGDVVEILVAEPAARIDILAWTTKTGHEVIRIDEIAAATRIDVRRVR